MYVISEQIRTCDIIIYSGEGIYTIIENQIASITSKGNTSDIYRGKLYKALTLGSDYVTLILNTDGIPVFKSSKYEFWPLYLLINELPFKMRSVILDYTYCRTCIIVTTSSL